MKFHIVALLLVIATVTSGIVRGRLDQRWGPTDEMLAAAERVASIPTELGPWRAQSLDELSDDTVSMLRCTGNVFRTYVHQQTGKQVSVVFMVGPAGPLAIHTPDVCYRSSNYSEHEARARRKIVDVKNNEHEFFMTTFQENNIASRLLRVYYSWNCDGRWRAPWGARTAFAGVPMLYKIQVATHVVEGVKESDTGQQFLRDALPFLHGVYAPTKTSL